MADRDLVDLMIETAAKLRTEIEREQKLHTIQTIEEQRLLLANVLGLLRELKPKNGTEYEAIRRHRDRITEHLSRVA